MEELRFRAFLDGDIPLFAKWLEKEYIKKWYHEPEDWLAEVKGRNGEYSWIHHFIVAAGDHPIGFCQYYDCFDAGEMEDWYEVTRPGNTYSIDYLIGDEQYLGKGYGKKIVQMLTQKLRDEVGAKEIVVQPEGENTASNRVLIKNGYYFDEERKYYRKVFE